MRILNHVYRITVTFYFKVSAGTPGSTGRIQSTQYRARPGQLEAHSGGPGPAPIEGTGLSTGSSMGSSTGSSTGSLIGDFHKGIIWKYLALSILINFIQSINLIN